MRGFRDGSLMLYERIRVDATAVRMAPDGYEYIGTIPCTRAYICAGAAAPARLSYDGACHVRIMQQPYSDASSAICLCDETPTVLPQYEPVHHDLRCPLRSLSTTGVNSRDQLHAVPTRSSSDCKNFRP